MPVASIAYLILFNVVNSLPILLYSVHLPITSTTAKQRTPSNFLLAYHVSSTFSPNEANLGSYVWANATLNSGIKPGNALLLL